MAGVAADKLWKDKYRDLVRDYENKEREWAELERALRAAAGKLALAALGHGSALDKAVEGVMAALQADLSAARLDASLSGVVRALQLPHAERAAVAAAERAPSAAAPPRPGDARPPDGDLEVLLRGLLTALARTPALAEAAHKLEQPLDAGVAVADWPSYLRKVADSVGAVVEQVQAQRRELEEFLEQVTQQLAEFETWTAWQEGAAKSRRADSVGLEHKVEAEMRGLQQEVTESRELAALKGKVKARLDTVASQLLEFRDTEERRWADSEQRTNELRREVVKLKGRTNDLIKLCTAQESRLMFDSLTGAHSRYAYEQRIEEEYQRWQRHAQPLTYSIWDIDLFKRVNDTYGHDAGDKLLRGVADLLARHKRVEDFLARIGGEEFVLLLPMTTLEAAKAVAEKLRAAVEHQQFRHHGQHVPVTMSCGLTEFRSGDTPTSVYERGDRALYQAKELGRNRCVAD